MNLSKFWASLLLSMTIFAVVTTGVTSMSEAEAEAYLDRYGYKNMSEAAGNLTALEIFQANANIDVTGELDNATIAMMETPRCGCPDNNNNNNNNNNNRYSWNGFSKWYHCPVTHRYIPELYTEQLTNTVVDTVTRDAFNIWENVANIQFKHETNNGKDPDILMLFASFAHGDGFPFDGRGGVLAHAFFPPFGDLHLDNSEMYLNRDIPGGVNLLRVMVHEIGHSIGLGHSSFLGSVMYPFYSTFAPNFQLHQDDIDGAVAIYGPKPDPCQGSKVDAIVNMPGGKVYAFIGKECYRLVRSTNGITRIKRGYPQPIWREFPGLPNDIQAAFVYQDSTYFFKKGTYWQMIHGWIVRIGLIKNRFPRVRRTINAAFEGDNGDVFFLRDKKYYKFWGAGKKLRHGKISRWGLNLRYPNAAMKFKDGRIYVFKGDYFYCLDPWTYKVLPGFPKPTAPYWFGCHHY